MEKDRPLECGGCQKPLSVEYKEIVDQTVSCFHACSDCPVLERRLHGNLEMQASHPTLQEGLCCNNCHTSLQEVRSGNALGCSECYAVFGDVVSDLLKNQESIAPHIGDTLHVGKSPHQSDSPLSPKKITELNQELNHALDAENYEEAAWLRDQIKDLMEKTNE